MLHLIEFGAVVSSAVFGILLARKTGGGHTGADFHTFHGVDAHHRGGQDRQASAAEAGHVCDTGRMVDGSRIRFGRWQWECGAL